jgi:O-antigen/teichoic acid export membrane protein
MTDAPTPPPPRRLLSDKALLIGSTFLGHVLRIGTTLVMARLVTPDEYGLYALVILVPAFLVSFGDFNIPGSLIQIRDHDEREVFDTAFACMLVLAAFYLLCFLGGGLYLYAYSANARHNPTVIVLGALHGVLTVMQMVYAIQLASLNRGRRFLAETLQNLIFSFSTAATGIIAAFAGAGVYALILQALAGQFLANLFILRKSSLSFPRFFRWDVVRRFLKLGGIMSAANYAGTLEYRVYDYVVVRNGGDLGKQQLGEWGRTTTVQNLFSHNINTALDRVTFTTLCSNTDDPARFREVARRAFEAMFLINCFTAAWLYVTAPDLVRLALGSQWTAVPPLLQIVAIAVPAGAIGSIGHQVCYARGKLLPQLIWSVARAVVLVPLALLLPFTSLAFIAWIWTASRYINAAGLLGTALRIAGPPPRSTFIRTALILAATAIAAATMHFSQLYLAQIPFYLRLLIVSAIGFAAYLGFIYLTAREMLLFLTRMARGR